MVYGNPYDPHNPNGTFNVVPPGYTGSVSQWNYDLAASSGYPPPGLAPSGSSGSILGVIPSGTSPAMPVGTPLQGGVDVNINQPAPDTKNPAIANIISRLFPAPSFIPPNYPTYPSVNPSPLGGLPPISLPGLFDSHPIDVNPAMGAPAGNQLMGTMAALAGQPPGTPQSPGAAQPFSMDPSGNAGQAMQPQPNSPGGSIPMPLQGGVSTSSFAGGVPLSFGQVPMNVPPGPVQQAMDMGTATAGPAATQRPQLSPGSPMLKKMIPQMGGMVPPPPAVPVGASNPLQESTGTNGDAERVVNATRQIIAAEAEAINQRYDGMANDIRQRHDSERIPAEARFNEIQDELAKDRDNILKAQALFDPAGFEDADSADNNLNRMALNKAALHYGGFRKGQHDQSLYEKAARHTGGFGGLVPYTRPMDQREWINTEAARIKQSIIAAAQYYASNADKIMDNDQKRLDAARLQLQNIATNEERELAAIQRDRVNELGRSANASVHAAGLGVQAERNNNTYKLGKDLNDIRKLGVAEKQRHDKAGEDERKRVDDFRRQHWGNQDATGARRADTYEKDVNNKNTDRDAERERKTKQFYVSRAMQSMAQLREAQKAGLTSLVPQLESQARDANKMWFESEHAGLGNRLQQQYDARVAPLLQKGDTKGASEAIDQIGQEIADKGIPFSIDRLLWAYGLSNNSPSGGGSEAPAEAQTW